MLCMARPICLRLLALLHARGGLADLLDGGQQQADEDGDDGDDDEQFDQRERSRRFEKAANCGTTYLPDER